MSSNTKRAYGALTLAITGFVVSVCLCAGLLGVIRPGWVFALFFLGVTFMLCSEIVADPLYGGTATEPWHKTALDSVNGIIYAFCYTMLGAMIVGFAPLVTHMGGGSLIVLFLIGCLGPWMVGEHAEERTKALNPETETGATTS